MRLDEFKAWFEGFTESMKNPPNEKQWERIKQRIAEIDGAPVTEKVFVERYVSPWKDYWREYRPYYVSNTLATLCSSSSTATINGNDLEKFCSTKAMYDAGRVEAGIK